MEKVLLAYESSERKAPEVSVQGVVAYVFRQDGRLRIELADAAVRLSDSERLYWEPKMLVTAEEASVPRSGFPVCGMDMEVQGRISLFPEAGNPGEFDSRLYYRGEKMICQVKAKEIREALPVAERENRRRSFRPLLHAAGTLREWGRKALSEICCERDRGMFQAILLGDRTELSEELKELFQENGIAHILAVSGLHVSLIGMTLYRGLRFLGLGYGASGGIVSLVLLLYGSVTGFSASVFRAIFMVLCALLAGWLGRTYDLLSAMFLSLFLLALDSPFLLYSGGLQLSYGAVLAVGILGELPKETSVFPDSLRLGIAVQGMTLPILLYHFFRYPLFSLLLNLLVIPLMSLAAGSGIAAVGLFAVGEALGRMTGGAVLSALLQRTAGSVVGPGHYIFQFYRSLCAAAGSLPLASILAGRPEFWEIGFYYAALFWWYRNQFQKRKWRSRYRAFLLLCLGILLLFTKPVHGLHIWFLDVGQGDGVLLQTASGTILYDCGSSQDRNVGKNRLVPFLESQGIDRLDYVLVSHGDSDHMNGILWLMEEENKLLVDRLVLPMAGYGQEEYDRLVQAARCRGTEISYLAAGDGLKLGKLSLDCIHPERERKGGQPGDDRNEQSLVFHVKYGEFSLLLTGDIGAEEEKKLRDRLGEDYGFRERRLTVLKAAHHGSAGSSSREFLAAVHPEIAILSYGIGNSYGHPSPEAVERLEEAGAVLWETAKSGAIYLKTDGTKLWIRPFR